MRLFETLSRKKPITDSSPTQLAKVLSATDLTLLGIGSTLGVGVYVLAGEVAKTKAGPAVIFSFMIAAIASVFAGLCYAEFGAKVPRAGSAYVYCYVTIGEFIAFIIGWNLILEYSIGAASVVKGLSTYVNSSTGINDYMVKHMPLDIGDGFSEFFDVFAFAVTILFSLAVAFGAKESLIVNNVFTFLNLSVVLFVIIAGSFKANPSNWNIPAENVTNTDKNNYGSGGFAPYGITGILKGAATCFYGFIGFDCIATAGEEAKNPKRSMPIAIILSLFVIFLAYFCISTVLTMMLPYYLQDPDAPLPHVFDVYEWTVAKYIVTFGAIFGLCASLMGAVFPLPRVIYAMSNDGLIFEWLGRIHPRFKTPLWGTLFVGTLTGLLAAFFNLSQLVDMMSIGTLMAYSIVAACVLLLRYEVDENDNVNTSAPLFQNRKRFLKILWNMDNLKTPNKMTAAIVTWAVTVFCIACILFALIIEKCSDQLREFNLWACILLTVVGSIMLFILFLISRQPTARTYDTFAVPLTPWLPGISIMINMYLMMMLDIMTWVRFIIWITIGLTIYLSYGMRNSVEGRRRQKLASLNNTVNLNEGSPFISNKETVLVQ